MSQKLVTFWTAPLLLKNAQRFRRSTDAARIKQKQDDMFLIAGKCGTLIRRDKGAGSRLLANARKS